MMSIVLLALILLFMPSEKVIILEFKNFLLYNCKSTGADLRVSNMEELNFFQKNTIIILAYAIIYNTL